MSIGAVFTSYVHCVKSIAHFKTNTLQANLEAMIASAAPVGVAYGAYSLYGRVSKQGPSSKETCSDALKQSVGQVDTEFNEKDIQNALAGTTFS